MLVLIKVLNVEHYLLIFPKLVKDFQGKDCLPHSLLVAKLSRYGFDIKALRFISNYLRDRKQRTKISDTYSSWEEVLYGVLQRSILGPLLFNIDLCDLFVLMDQHDIANYADDNTPFASGKTLMRLLNRYKKHHVLFLNGLATISSKEIQANVMCC